MFVIRTKMSTFAACFLETRLFVAQFLRRTATSNEMNGQNKYTLKLRIYADFNHSVFGAVAGLSESMGRGLRIPLRNTETKKIVINIGRTRQLK